MRRLGFASRGLRDIPILLLYCIQTLSGSRTAPRIFSRVYVREPVMLIQRESETVHTHRKTDHLNS